MVSSIPSVFQRRTGSVEPGNTLEDQLDRMRSQAKDISVYVVFLDNVDWRFYMISEQDLREAFALELLISERDGRIYKMNPPPV